MCELSEKISNLTVGNFSCINLHPCARIRKSIFSKVQLYLSIRFRYICNISMQGTLFPALSENSCFYPNKQEVF